MIKQENHSSNYFEHILMIHRDHDKSVKALCVTRRAMLRAVEILIRRPYTNLSVKPVKVRQYGYERFHISITY